MVICTISHFCKDNHPSELWFLKNKIRKMKNAN